MLKADIKPELKKRAKIGQLVQNVTADGLRWAEAEAALMRAELADFRRRMVTAVICSIVALAALLAALVVFSQAGVAWIAPYLDSNIAAELVVGAGLLTIALASAFAVRRAFTMRSRSLLLRWLNTAAEEPGLKL